MTVLARLLRSTLPALAVALLAVPVAQAQDTAAPAVAVPDSAVSAVPQTGGIAAGAVAAATTTQQSPSNVTVQVIVNSPGAVAVVNQVNAAGAAAEATAPPPVPSVPAMPAAASAAAGAPATPRMPAVPTASAAPSVPQAPSSPAVAVPATPVPVPVPAAATAPLEAAAPQPAAVGAGGESTARSTHPARHAPRRHRPASAPVLRAAGPAAVAAPAARFAGLAAATTHAAPPHVSPRPRADGDARHSSRRVRAVTRAPHRPAALPPDAPGPASAAGAGTAGGGAGGTMLALTLVAALLLTGSAGPYELVALLRRRAPSGAGGRLERPG